VSVVSWRVKMTEPAELFEAISHPSRIRILRILDKQPSSFSMLKHQLKIDSSGNLDHHLKKLGQLIRVGSNGLYVLTDGGREGLRAIDAIDAWKRLEAQKIRAFADAPPALKALVTLEIALAFAAAISTARLLLVWRLSLEVFFQPVYAIVALLGFLVLYGFSRGRRWTWTLATVKAALVIFHAIIPVELAVRIWQATQPVPAQLVGFLPFVSLAAMFVGAEAGVLLLASRESVRTALGSRFTTPLSRRALVGGILGVVGGVLEIITGNAVLWAPGPYGAGPLAVLGVFMFACGLTIAVGGVLILLRNYRLGGVLVIVFNLFPLPNYLSPQQLLLYLFPALNTVAVQLVAFAVFILFVMGGVLALMSRPKL
jgi:DNA-binding transcriptional ArsR family regulator